LSCISHLGKVNWILNETKRNIKMFVMNIRWVTYPKLAASERGISLEIELRLLPFGMGPVVGRWITGSQRVAIPGSEYFIPCPESEAILWKPGLPAGTLSIRSRGIDYPGHKIYAEGIFVRQDITPFRLLSPSLEWTEWQHFTLNPLP
jgi:hypothetical protein